MQLWLSDTNCIWEKTRDSVAEKEEQKVPRLIKVFLEKEKTFVGTATELCHKLKEMFNEDFSANSLGKTLNKCQFVLMKQGIIYDNTRNHDKRQISLTLDNPEKEQKESDDLMADELVLNEELDSKDGELGHTSIDEVEHTYGQVHRERLVMYEPEKKNFEDEFTPSSGGVNEVQSEQVHHGPRTMDGEAFVGDTFSFKMRPEQ